MAVQFSVVRSKVDLDFLATAFIVMVLFWFYFSGLSNRDIRKLFSQWRQEPD